MRSAGNRPNSAARQSFASVGRRAVDALLAEIESGDREVDSTGFAVLA